MMITFSAKNMTHKRLTNNTFQLRIGNDIIIVYTNFEHLEFPEELFISLDTHYIKYPDNKPTNPNRTSVLMAVVRDYFSNLIMKEMEEDTRKLASLPATGKLERDFKGKRFNFWRGKTATDILDRIQEVYNGYGGMFAVSSKDFYFIMKELKDTDGFLSDAIAQELSWV